MAAGGIIRRDSLNRGAAGRRSRSRQHARARLRWKFTSLQNCALAMGTPEPRTALILNNDEPRLTRILALPPYAEDNRLPRKMDSASVEKLDLWQ